MANEQMEFPGTWEEYEQDYGFNDSEEVYTNNSRLIQSFRVKQWLDHLPSVQPTDKENLVVEDCISREEVCDYIAEFVNHEYATDREREMVKNIIGGIQHLQSVQPKTELETWEGIHAQVTAPKGTFDKIWNEAEDNDEI